MSLSALCLHASTPSRARARARSRPWTYLSGVPLPTSRDDDSIRHSSTRPRRRPSPFKMSAQQLLSNTVAVSARTSRANATNKSQRAKCVAKRSQTRTNAVAERTSRPRLDDARDGREDDEGDFCKVRARSNGARGARARRQTPGFGEKRRRRHASYPQNERLTDENERF